MNNINKFYAEARRQDEIEFLVLGYTDGADPENNVEAWIAPDFGSNLFRFSYGSHAIINSNIGMLAQSGFPGTPVLYPTPNRVRDAKFTYRGRDYEQIKNGKPVPIHGLVLNEAWEYGNLHSDERGAYVTTWIDFKKGTAVYGPFPFEHRLSIDFRLTAEGIGITYLIDNMDTVEIPFGFALHPFFEKLSGDENTYLRIPADHVMESTSDWLPTGKLMDVNGTKFDLKKDTAVGETDMNHVFTSLTDGEYANIYYGDIGINLSLETSPDFSHIVFYSPGGAGIFCIENQTCSTDAHNLYNKGFVRESGLKVVMPGETRTGSVQYRVSRK